MYCINLLHVFNVFVILTCKYLDVYSDHQHEKAVSWIRPHYSMDICHAPFSELPLTLEVVHYFKDSIASTFRDSLILVFNKEWTCTAYLTIMVY